MLSNRGSGLPAGSFCMSLLLTREAEGWQHEWSEKKRAEENASVRGGAYSTLKCRGDPSCSFPGDDLVVVRQETLLLPLGLVCCFEE